MGEITVKLADNVDLDTFHKLIRSSQPRRWIFTSTTTEIIEMIEQNVEKLFFGISCDRISFRSSGSTPVYLLETLMSIGKKSPASIIAIDYEWINLK